MTYAVADNRVGAPLFSDRMLVAQMDASVVPLSTMTSEIAELEAALGKVTPTEARADFARGLRFAADTLRGLPHDIRFYRVL